MNIHPKFFLFLVLYVFWALAFQLLGREQIGVLVAVVIVAAGSIFSQSVVNLVYNKKINIGGAVYHFGDEGFYSSKYLIAIIQLVYIAVWPLIYFLGSSD